MIMVPFIVLSIIALAVISFWNMFLIMDHSFETPDDSMLTFAIMFISSMALMFGIPLQGFIIVCEAWLAIPILAVQGVLNLYVRHRIRYHKANKRYRY